MIVAPLYSAGEQPIEGIDQHRRWPRASARRATVGDGASTTRASSWPMLRTPGAARRYGRSVSAPATRPNGRTRCPTGWPRRSRTQRRRRAHRELARTNANPEARRRRFPTSPPSSRRAAALRGRLTARRRWPTSPGSASAARRRCCSSPADEADLAYFLARHAGRPAGVRRRARVQPAGARRRHAGRRDPARPRLRRRSTAEDGQPHARRHGGARREGGARGGRRRHRRAGVLSRHSRHRSAARCA